MVKVYQKTISLILMILAMIQFEIFEGSLECSIQNIYIQRIQILLSIYHSLLFIYSIHLEGNYFKYLNYFNLQENYFFHFGIIKIILFICLSCSFDFGIQFHSTRTIFFNSKFTLKRYSVSYQRTLEDFCIIVRILIHFLHIISLQFYQTVFMKPFMIQVLLRKDKGILGVFQQFMQIYFFRSMIIGFFLFILLFTQIMRISEWGYYRILNEETKFLVDTFKAQRNAFFYFQSAFFNIAMIETTYGGKVSIDTILGQFFCFLIVVLGTVLNSMLIYGVLVNLNFNPQQEKVWILINQVEQKDILKKEC